MIHMHYSALKGGWDCKRVQVLVTDFKGSEAKSKIVCTLLTGGSSVCSFIHSSYHWVPVLYHTPGKHNGEYNRYGPCSQEAYILMGDTVKYSDNYRLLHSYKLHEKNSSCPFYPQTTPSFSCS